MSNATNYREMIIKNYGKDDKERATTGAHIKKYVGLKIRRDVTRGFIGEQGWKPKGIVKKIFNGMGVTKWDPKINKSSVAPANFKSLYDKTKTLPYYSSPIESAPNYTIPRSDTTRVRDTLKFKKTKFNTIDIVSQQGTTPVNISMSKKEMTTILGSSNESHYAGSSVSIDNKKWYKPKNAHKMSDYSINVTDHLSHNKHILAIQGQTQYLQQTGTYAKIGDLSNSQNTAFAKTSALMSTDNGLSYLEKMINSNSTTSNMRFLASRKKRNEYRMHARQSFDNNWMATKEVMNGNHHVDRYTNTVVKDTEAKIKRLEERVESIKHGDIDGSLDKLASKKKKILSNTDTVVNAVNKNKRTISEAMNMQMAAKDIIKNGTPTSGVHSSLSVLNNMIGDIADKPDIINETIEKLSAATTALQEELRSSGATFAKNAAKNRVKVGLTQISAVGMTAVTTAQMIALAASGIIGGAETILTKINEISYETGVKIFGNNFGGKIIQNDRAMIERKEALDTIAFNHNINKQFIGNEASEMARGY